jgi:hypothetical protein
LAGKVFFLSMIMVAAHAIWTSTAANQHFVLMLAVLSGYLVIRGYRELYLALGPAWHCRAGMPRCS